MYERRLPDFIDSFMEYTDNSEAPAVFRKWVAVSIVAAVMQRKCWLAWDTITYPNMYIILVGPSGCRKNTAMNPAQEILRAIGMPLASESITREALIKELNEHEYSAVTADGRAITHSSMTIFAKELTVFLGYDNRQLIMDLTDWYDCDDSWTYRTKGSGTNSIIGVWVNMLGGTTPTLLNSTLTSEAASGGLTGRMIFVYAGKKGKSVPFPHLLKVNDNLRDGIINDLNTIAMMGGEFKIDEDFFNEYAKWYPQYEQNPPFHDDRLAGYVERRPKHMLKLAMILSASRSDSRIMTVADMHKADALLREIEVNMPRVVAGIGKSDIGDIVTRVLTEIASNKSMLRSELMARHYNDVDRDGLNRVLATLSAMGKVKIEAIQGGDVRLTYDGKNG